MDGMKQSRRFLVGKMDKRDTRKEISHEEIARAILTFKAKGGLIKQLAPERGGSKHVVGKHLGSPYETLSD